MTPLLVCPMKRAPIKHQILKKRVLIAELSDITRQAAETVLRQNGFEVITVSSGDMALQLLERSKPHLNIASSYLSGKGRAGFIRSLQAEPTLSTIPVIRLADENEPGFPDEIKVNLPLDPNDLLSKIYYMANDSKKSKKEANNPLSESLEDELLDEALGLDQIDVTDSEVMNQSETSKIGKKKKVVEKMIGMDHVTDDTEITSQTGSVNLDAKSGKIKKSGKPASSKTGKLDIVSGHDQFGLGDESLLEHVNENADHDYDWFVNEMKTDVINPKSAEQQKAAPQPESLKVTKPADQIERVSVPSKKSSDSKKVAGGKKTGGVDKFIEEFKREVESFSNESSKSVIETKSKPAATAKPANVSSEPIDNITIDQIEVFTRQFVSDLADRVAERIANKIDAQKLMSLLKNEIVSKARNSK